MAIKNSADEIVTFSSDEIIINKVKSEVGGGDTAYDEATTSTAGLMSASDKTKLEGIASGAEVNQNALSNVVVGGTTLAADSTTDTLTITAGDNITLTSTASSDSFVIAATDTTYNEATTSAAGLMSAEDKTKLDGITESVVFTCPDNLIVKQSSSTQAITAYCYLTEGDADVTVGSYSLSVSIPSSMSGISLQTETSGNNSFKILIFLVTSDATPSGYITVTCTYGDLTIVRYINVTTIYSESDGSSGSTVSYSASVSSGTTLGTLTIDGTGNSIVAPDAMNVLTTSSGTANASTTNTTTYLKLIEGDSSVKSSIQIKGSGNTSVSGSDGVLTIGSTVDLSNYYTIDEVNALIDALREELSGSSSGTTVTFTAVTVIEVDTPSDAMTGDLSGTTLTYYLGSDGCMYTRPTASSSYYAADGYYASTSCNFVVEDGDTDYDYTKLTRKVYIVNSSVFSTTNVTWSVE